MKRRIITTACALALVLSLLPQAAFAANGDSTPATPKTETVYVNLNNGGGAVQTYVVNAFDVDGSETIYDFGNYAEVKNLTDTSEITVADGKISATPSGGTFYYQGKLEQTELPWEISVRYFLDGVEMTAEKIAGKSGAFELRIAVMAGSPRYKAFFEQYMMQISLTLNKDLCTNIQSDGAGVNVVGKTASVSYTHAMNTEAEYILNADVKNFAMGAISFRAATIGGLGLNLDDGLLDGFGDDFNALTDATGALSENAGKLADGSDLFYSGIKDMNAQAKTFSGGVGELYAKTGELNNGAAAFGEGLSAYNDGIAAIAAASEHIAQSLSEMNQQASALPSPNQQLVAYAQTLTEGDDPNLAALALAYLAQNEVLSTFANGISSINTAYTQFNTSLQAGADISKLTTSYAQIQSGVTALYAALKQLDTAAAETLLPGIGTMISSYEQLNDATGKLADAISELDTKAAEIPGTIKEKVDELLESYLPSEPVKLSFTSDENATDSVLFIMQTDEIAAPTLAADIAPDSHRPETFWEKLLNLFGLWQPEN
jgi:exonuclease VII small subunit